MSTHLPVLLRLRRRNDREVRCILVLRHVRMFVRTHYHQSMPLLHDLLLARLCLDNVYIFTASEPTATLDAPLMQTNA